MRWRAASQREGAVVEETLEVLLAAEHERRDQRELPGRESRALSRPTPHGPVPIEGEEDDGGAEREPERQVRHVGMSRVREQVRPLIARSGATSRYVSTCAA